MFEVFYFILAFNVAGPLTAFSNIFVFGWSLYFPQNAFNVKILKRTQGLKNNFKRVFLREMYIYNINYLKFKSYYIGVSKILFLFSF